MNLFGVLVFAVVGISFGLLAVFFVRWLYTGKWPNHTPGDGW